MPGRQGGARGRPIPTRLCPSPLGPGARRRPADTSPRGGQGARPRGRGPGTHARARCGARADKTRAQAAPDGEHEGTFLGHAESRHPPEGRKREGPRGRAAPGSASYRGERACTRRAGRGRRAAPDGARGHRKCAGRAG